MSWPKNAATTRRRERNHFPGPRGRPDRLEWKEEPGVRVLSVGWGGLLCVGPISELKRNKGTPDGSIAPGWL
jgi:hypothetical protein